jgi:hypothetical protein
LVVGLRRWGTTLPVLWSGKMKLLCGRELLRLLLKIRGKGGGCPGLVLKERELSLVVGCCCSAERESLLAEGRRRAGSRFVRAAVFCVM